MRERDFQVGDNVRIRQWDDMKEEFGLDSDGDIDCEFSFIEEMEYLCGREFSITDMFCGIIYGLDDEWEISEDMIELVE